MIAATRSADAAKSAMTRSSGTSTTLSARPTTVPVRSLPAAQCTIAAPSLEAMASSAATTESGRLAR